MSPAASAHIAIAGAGIGGLTAALNLRKRGLEVDVFEQADSLAEVGAGIQLSPNAMHVLRHLGLADELEKVACEPAFAALRHYRTGKPYFTSPMRGPYEQRYGAKYLHVHRADLIDVLAKAAERAGVRLHPGKAISGCQQSGGGITLLCQDGASFEASLLVGADGIHSAVRRALFGADTPEFTGHVAWRGLVPAQALPPDAVPPGHRADVWLGPGRHFVAYGLRGGRLVNFVAVEERRAWAKEGWNEPGDMVEVQQAFRGWDPAVTAILEACERCFLWGLFDRRPLPRWYKGRAVLLGDACHPMLPFQAQGGAMAVEDGYVLAACLSQIAGNWQDSTAVEAALAAYQRGRKPRVSRLQALSRSNARMFHAAGWPARLQRRLLFAVGHLLPRVMAARLDSIYGVNVTEA